MILTGTIKVIMDTQQISDSFRKRELVVTTDDKYPQDILIQFTQDKCDVLNKYKAGEQVEIAYNLRGRGWEKDGVTRYFNTIEGWKIDYSGEHADAIQGQSFEEQVHAAKGEDSGLPF